MKDITVAPGQPFIVAIPKAGAAVTADQVALDFTLVVDSDGCYVVDVSLIATWTDVVAGPDGAPSIAVNRVTVLSEGNTLAPVCLAKGATTFRAAPSAPAPAGAAMPPAPPAGARTLAIDGAWPSVPRTSLALSFQIDVYRIGPCSGGQCAQVLRTALAKATRYMWLEGPRVADPDEGTKLRPIDRTLAMREARVTTPGLLASRVGGPLTRTRSVSATTRHGVYTVCRAQDEATYGERALFVEWRPHVGGDTAFSFAAIPTWPSLEAAAHALVNLERSLERRDLGSARFYAGSFVLHGILRVHGNGATRLAPFVHGRPIYGLLQPGDLPLAFAPHLAPDILGWFFDDDDDDDDTGPIDEITVWVKTRIEGGFLHATGEVLAHIWAFGLGWSIFGPDDIIFKISDFTRRLAATAARHNCIKVLKIMSHGGKLVTPGGAVVGSTICIGETDTLSSEDFDDDGNVLATAHAQATKDLLDALKAAMCPNGRIIFSACNQGVGGLLQHISSYIDHGVTVEGNSELGIPYVGGDMTYVDGSRQ